MSGTRRQSSVQRRASGSLRKGSPGHGVKCASASALGNWSGGPAAAAPSSTAHSLRVPEPESARARPGINRHAAAALNLYQRDPGPVQGEPHIKAVDPSRTTIAGNFRYFYFFRDVDMPDYPPIARKMGLAHWKMDNDPIVWKQAEMAILAEIAAWEVTR